MLILEKKVWNVRWLRVCFHGRGCRFEIWTGNEDPAWLRRKKINKKNSII